MFRFFSVSRHFWKVKVFGNRIFAFFGHICYFLKNFDFRCFTPHLAPDPTGSSKVSRNRENSKILWIRKVSRNRENSKILWIRKVSRNRENSKILWIRKVSRNRKMTKSFVIKKTWLTRGTERPFRCLDDPSYDQKCFQRWAHLTTRGSPPSPRSPSSRRSTAHLPISRPTLKRSTLRCIHTFMQ